MWKPKPKYAFRRQIYHAKQRGIKFKFTYVQWVGWWERQLGPDWFTLRGRGKGKYCMARKGDQGPYAGWNVECKTNTENRLEQTPKGGRGRVGGFGSGEVHPRAKLSDSDIVAIRSSKLTSAKLAIKYAVNYSTIWRIKAGERWR